MCASNNYDDQILDKIRVDLNNLEIKEVLGKGAESVVKKGHMKLSTEEFAVKICHISSDKSKILSEIKLNL